MKILVTGGAGFIGRYLINSLLENKHQVTIFDNFSNSKNDLISSFMDREIKIKKGDLQNFDELSDALTEQEVVIHLAAKISVEESIRDPLSIKKTNVDGTINLLKIMSERNLNKLIVASSAAVYGDINSDEKLTENSQINPVSPYGESKSIMEREIFEYISNNKINCVVLRFFNIFGAGQTPQYAGVISKFIECVKNEKPIEVFGDGTQTRDFISIHDIVASIINSIDIIQNKKFEIFNIASGKSVTINELIKTIMEIAGKKVKIEYRPFRDGDIKFSNVSIEKAEKEMNFHPKFSLKQGLMEMMK